MGELTKAVGEFIVNNVSFTIIVIFVVLSGLFKIIKIEVNPLGWLVGCIGRGLNKDIKKDVVDLRKDIDTFEKNTNQSIDAIRSKNLENYSDLRERISNMERSNDFQTLRQIRTHVLEFANSCRIGRGHTQEEFRSVFDENKEYENIMSKYPGTTNDYYVEAMKFIRRVYQKCLDNNDFLA